ncbi:MAG: c-type cytochrome [Chloroflexi bacterium]|nr:c-type cytochrome [Chloroflexota bacterium]
MNNRTSQPNVTGQSQAQKRSGLSWQAWLAGLIIGVVGTLVLVVLIGMPLAIGHRTDLPLEKLYGSLAVGLAVKTQAGNATNPLGQNGRALEAGRNAYIGMCAECHGANGDGKGIFGQQLYPPATDLRAEDTKEKSDAELFWIIKNGLSFAGMPGFAKQLDDQTIWALVSYTRSFGQGQSGAQAIPTPTAGQLALADPAGDAVHRGAAVYFAQACHECHGPVGNAPGELGLRGGGREAQEALRRGRQGMPAYNSSMITNAQMSDLVAYMNTFPGGGQRFGR